MSSKSQLWQRLRSALDFSGLRQEDIAKACTLAGFKVSRSGVAQWISVKPENRTRPSIDQLKVFARATKVPVEFLLNDNYAPEEVYSLGGDTPAKKARLTPRQLQNLVEVKQVPSEEGDGTMTIQYAIRPEGHVTPKRQRTAKRFKVAVEFDVASRHPELADAFDVDLGQDPLGGKTTAEFYNGKALVYFGITNDPTANLGRLMQVAMARACVDKDAAAYLFLWRERNGNYPGDDSIEAFTRTAETFGVSVRCFEEMADAVEAFIKLVTP